MKTIAEVEIATDRPGCRHVYRAERDGSDERENECVGKALGEALLIINAADPMNAVEVLATASAYVESSWDFSCPHAMTFFQAAANYLGYLARKAPARQEKPQSRP